MMPLERRLRLWLDLVDVYLRPTTLRSYRDPNWPAPPGAGLLYAAWYVTPSGVPADRDRDCAPRSPTPDAPTSRRVLVGRAAQARS
jgi:hypothetical protein